MGMMEADLVVMYNRPCVWRPVSVGSITPLLCTVLYCAVQRVMAWEGACKQSANITAVSSSQCYHHHHQAWHCCDCDTPGHCLDVRTEGDTLTQSHVRSQFSVKEAEALCRDVKWLHPSIVTLSIIVWVVIVTWWYFHDRGTHCHVFA